MPLFRRWRARAARNEDARWIVVDTETGGLDPARDPLLAIGAVAIRDGAVHAGDSFEMLLQNRAGTSERANIELHGIGRDAQRNATPSANAIAAFAAWAGAAPRFAFHADFDRAFLERCAREVGVTLADAPWIDVARLAAALASKDRPRDRGTTLDEWLSAYGIACNSRHNAASDALATAELLLRLRAEAAKQGAFTPRDLARVARHARWLGAH